MNKKTLICAFLTLTGFIFSSCSFFDSNNEIAERAKERRALSRAVQQETAQNTAETVKIEPRLTDVEIIWTAAEDGADGYIIRYGYDKDSLNMTDKVSIGEVINIQDPTHGHIVKYVVRNIEASKRLYISVASYKDDSESIPSQIFVVSPMGE